MSRISEDPRLIGALGVAILAASGKHPVSLDVLGSVDRRQVRDVVVVGSSSRRALPAAVLAGRCAALALAGMGAAAKASFIELRTAHRAERDGVSVRDTVELERRAGESLSAQRGVMASLLRSVEDRLWKAPTPRVTLSAKLIGLAIAHPPGRRERMTFPGVARAL